MSYTDPAPLTARLLVKKGGARPAGFGSSAANENETVDGPTDIALPKQHSTASKPVAATRRQRSSLSLDLNGAVDSRRQSASPTKASDRARLTLRLDTDRHLRLRLTAAHLDVSLQELVTTAVDAYLNEISPDVINGSCICLTKPGFDRKSDRTQ